MVTVRELDMDLTDDDLLDNYRHVNCEEIDEFNSFKTFYLNEENITSLK